MLWSFVIFKIKASNGFDQFLLYYPVEKKKKIRFEKFVEKYYSTDYCIFNDTTILNVCWKIEYRWIFILFYWVLLQKYAVKKKKIIDLNK